MDAAVGKERLKLTSKVLYETFQNAVIPQELFLLVSTNKYNMDDKLSAAQIGGLNLTGLKYEWISKG